MMSHSNTKPSYCYDNVSFIGWPCDAIEELDDEVVYQRFSPVIVSTASYAEMRRVQFPDDRSYHDAVFTWSEGRCSAIVIDNTNKKTRYFRLGCDHSYVEKKIGRCLYQYVCSKCSFEMTVDSSD